MSDCHKKHQKSLKISVFSVMMDGTYLQTMNFWLGTLEIRLYLEIICLQIFGILVILLFEVSLRPITRRQPCSSNLEEQIFFNLTQRSLGTSKQGWVLKLDRYCQSDSNWKASSFEGDGLYKWKQASESSEFFRFSILLTECLYKSLRYLTKFQQL